MCYYYAHHFTCKHTAYALGKYCTTGNFIQTPCKKRSIWQTICVGEDCEDCAVPDRGHGSSGGDGGVNGIDKLEAPGNEAKCGAEKNAGKAEKTEKAEKSKGGVKFRRVKRK
jgi:hypothetical protein